MSMKTPIITFRISPSTVLAIWVLILPALSDRSNHLNFSPYAHSFSDAKRGAPAAARLHKNFIWDDGWVCACSGKNLFAFERNGSIAWALHLSYTCNANIAPVHGGSSKACISPFSHSSFFSMWQIYLVAENRVLKISPLRIGTGESPVEVFFGPRQGGEEGPGKILGISASLSSSCVLITVQNQGLFAYRLHRQLIWSAGPVLCLHGYRQGCRKNITDCYFTSPPSIDHCEASIFMSNTIGELYSFSIRGHHFKWIRDLSSFGNAFTITLETTVSSVCYCAIGCFKRECFAARKYWAVEFSRL